MNKLLPFILAFFLCAVVALVLLVSAPAVKLVPAPPGPADLGPATGLSAPPPGALVFELKYLPQTGSPSDIQYRSFYGYGAADEETKTNTFLQDVRQKAGKLHYVCGYPFKDRKWSAVEYRGRSARALYFDLNGNGRLDPNERLQPSRKVPQGYEFITPDFVNTLGDGRQALCRALLQVNFYRGSSGPNAMWSPAALLEGTATVEGQPARLLLYANSPGGAFDKFGSSSYSLLSGETTQPKPDRYVPRERLSSLITSDGLPGRAGASNVFYRLAFEGRRTNGLPARVVLLKDTSPTGTLTVKLSSSNALNPTVSSLDLYGLDDQTVFFRMATGKDRVTLPIGAYSVENGSLTYGGSAGDWELWFSGGAKATVEAGKACDLALGEPVLKVRAMDERERYSSQPVECATFKRGARIWLSPRITGKGRETFTRFQHRTGASSHRSDVPPRLTITAPDGKQVLTSTMEYG